MSDGNEYSRQTVIIKKHYFYFYIIANCFIYLLLIATILSSFNNSKCDCPISNCDNDENNILRRVKRDSDIIANITKLCNFLVVNKTENVIPSSKYVFKKFNREQIRKAITYNMMNNDTTNFAIDTIYDILNSNETINWGGDGVFCEKIRDVFDLQYGGYWSCAMAADTINKGLDTYYTYAPGYGCIRFRFEDGLSIDVFKSATPTYTYKFKKFNREQIRKAINYNKMNNDRTNFAIDTIYDILNSNETINWGGYGVFCEKITDAFDRKYGRYWSCAMAVNKDLGTYYTYATGYGYIEFRFEDGLSIDVFKSATPTYEFKKFNREQIRKAITYNKMNNDTTNFAIDTIYDILNSNETINWGGTGVFCKKITDTFDRKYGGYWSCAMAADTIKKDLDTSYTWATGYGYIGFRFEDGLSIDVFKSKMPTHTIKKYTRQQIVDAIDIKNMNDDIINFTIDTLYEFLRSNNTIKMDESDICDHLYFELDNMYGKNWACASGDNRLYVKYLLDDNFVYFEFDDDFSIRIFRPATLNDYMFKKWTKQQITMSIYKNTMSNDTTNFAVDVLYDALNSKTKMLRNWEGGSKEVCNYIKEKFDYFHGEYWSCAMAADRENPLLTVHTEDYKAGHKGFIRFRFSDGLFIDLFKSATLDCKDDISKYILFLIIFTAVITILMVSFALFGFGFLAYFRIRLKKNEKTIELLSMNHPNIGQLKIIPVDKIQLNSEALGEGAFGQVFSGVYLSSNGNIKVAVKVIKSESYQERELLQEAGTMARLSHMHLTKLLGICLRENSAMIVMPLRSLGSLWKYLSLAGKKKSPLKSNLLIRYCYQIASGMEYLTDRGIVHRDLATRNVLMKSNDHVEISDFGLSNSISEFSVPEKFPVRWVAMEILISDKDLYSEKTDVWSFGVTCWEILTYAKRPYGEVVLDNDEQKVNKLYEHLNNGNRLTQPERCSLELYETLLYCWSSNPSSRPSFKELREKFERYNDTPTRVVLNKKVKISPNDPNYASTSDKYSGHKRIPPENPNTEPEAGQSQANDGFKFESFTKYSELMMKMVKNVGQRRHSDCEELTPNNSEESKQKQSNSGSQHSIYESKF